MSRLDDTLNKINFRSDYPYNGKVESLLKIIAINSAIICDKLDTIHEIIEAYNGGYINAKDLIEQLEKETGIKF